jgi:hypothetical protein
MQDDGPPVGGAATNKGIWFQALWIVLQAARSRLKASSTGDENAVVRIVLEPSGGDVRIEHVTSRRIVQLKVKSAGTWSLKDVVTEVLPDLYKAVDLNDPDATYEFVTEGRQGQWEGADAFFNALRGKTRASAKESYDSLSPTTKVRFLGSEDWLPTNDRTEKGLFDRIVDDLRGPTPEPGKADRREKLETVREKVWHLLSRFRFDGEHSPESVRLELNRILNRVVSSRDDIATLSNAMAGWIASRSAKNNAEITPKEILTVHGLRHPVAIAEALDVHALSRASLSCGLNRLKYRPTWDIRRGDFSDDHAEIIVLSGSGGEGKSWGGFALADLATTVGVVWMESSDDLQRDLETVAREFWQNTLRRDEAKPLASIADHLQDIWGNIRGTPWLTIVIDRVASMAVAEGIWRLPLGAWGVKVVLACEEHVAAYLEKNHGPGQTRMVFWKFSRFSLAQVNAYLVLRLGPGHLDIPPDIRELLRTPQYAAMYCDLAESSRDGASVLDVTAWHPTNEYELVDRFWHRLEGLTAPMGRSDGFRLRELTKTVLENGEYPWSDRDLREAEIDEPTAGRLGSAGWLRRTSTGEFYEIPHDRLLNYAVAKLLVDRCARKEIDSAALIKVLADHQLSPKGRRLGYLMMDWFHLAINDKRVSGMVPEVVWGISVDADYRHREEFLNRLLPSLGRRAMPLLLDLLRRQAAIGNWYELVPIVTGVTATLADAERDLAKNTILALLKDGNPVVRRAGLRLAAVLPHPELLDAVWAVHREIRAKPSVYGKTDVQSYRLKDDSFNAMSNCVKLAPAWLEDAIMRAGVNSEEIKYLGYLVADMEDSGAAWHRRKADLIEKTNPRSPDALIANIGKWRDASEWNRLEEWARTQETADGGYALVAPQALKAMAEIDAEKAISSLPQIDEGTLYGCRRWFLPRFFLLAGERTRETLFQQISASKDPSRSADVYQGNENEMDRRTIDLILDQLGQRLANIRTATDESAPRPILFLGLERLASVARTDLLTAFSARKDSALERDLEYYVGTFLGPQRGRAHDGREREPGLRVLLRINADAYERVLIAYLADPDHWARYDAIDNAMRYSGELIIAPLTQAALEKSGDEVYDEMRLQAAARVLLAKNAFASLLPVMQKLGLQAPRDLQEFKPRAPFASGDVVTEILKGVESEEKDIAHGSLITLALLDPKAAVSVAVKGSNATLRKEDRIAISVAIGVAKVPDEAAVTFLAGAAADTETAFAARRSLSLVKGDAAHEALYKLLDSEWDDSTAFYLLHRPAFATRVRSRFVEQINRNGLEPLKGLVGGDPLSFLLNNAEDVELGRIIRLISASVREELYSAAVKGDNNLWVRGAQHAGIRGLSFIDPATALQLAVHVFTKRDSRDRHLYPGLIYQMDSEVARVEFLKVAEGEKDATVVAAMVATLKGASDAAWLDQTIRSGSVEARRSACRLSEGLAIDHLDLFASVRRALHDPNEKVSEAAERACESIIALQRAYALVGLLREDMPMSDVAAVTDAAISLGHNGYEHMSVPAWLGAIFKHPAVKKYPTLMAWLEDVLAKKRKANLKTAENEAKRNR